MSTANPETQQSHQSQQAPSSQHSSIVPPKLDSIHETQETASSVEPKPEDVLPYTRVVVHTDIPYAPKCRFFPGKAKEVISAVLKEKLNGATYDPDSAPAWVREISDTIKSRLKDMALDRYKIVVQVVVGEQREQGFQMSCRCFWDPNTDNYAHDLFTNDSIFCIAGAFAMYLP